MLGKVVVDAEHVLALVPEILAHRAAGVGGDELERGRVRRRSADDDRVFEGVVLAEGLDDARDRRRLLADGHVDADDAGFLLVDDRVDGDGGLAGLAVADDQLALAPSDRDQGVDGLNAGLERFLHGLALHDVGGVHLGGSGFGRHDRSLAVERLPERIDDAAEHGVTDGHRDDFPGRLDQVAFVDAAVGAHDDAADVVLFEVEHEAAHAVRELDEFAGHHLLKTMHAGNAVTDLQNDACIDGFRLLRE
ncbi:MAG: hypothetical protein BWY66_01348 [bacterium ADurb.Bin374]|nr:MAG: hypothetical protein BWY66_01348 [bacterium ADurb.Bin374]